MLNANHLDRTPSETAPTVEPQDPAEAQPIAQQEGSAEAIPADATIQALDRLGEKLDRTADLLHQHLQGWQQRLETAAVPLPPDAASESAATGGRRTEGELDSKQTPSVTQAQSSQVEGPLSIEPGLGQDTAVQGLASDARRLVDGLSSSRNSWEQSLADLRQAVDAIMEYLENQAATALPATDLSDILERLKQLEEEQKNLQSRFNNSR
jgi:hypothetical protein